MSERRRYMRPIEELRQDAAELVEAIGVETGGLASGEEVQAAVVTLCGELIDELRAWRRMVGRPVRVDGPGLITVEMHGEPLEVRLTWTGEHRPELEPEGDE